MTKWGSLAVAVLVLFLALIFSAHAGFFQAAGAAAVVLAVGYLGPAQEARRRSLTRYRFPGWTAPRNSFLT